MRIIAGELKGRVISAPSGSATRPTTDALRETIFSTLEHLVDWPTSNMLDLCCGSGAMGFEALSRGALHATFVDANRTVCVQVEATAADLGLSDRCTIHCIKIEQYLGSQYRGSGEARKSNTGASDVPADRKFGVVFADPPYDLMLCNRIAKALVVKGLLAPGGLYVAEHGDREALLADEHWEHVAQKTRGAAVVDIRKLRNNRVVVE
ncbi:MAG: RsmD family RNA methyltransferase [bacterium]|nr:RsmD family RNA methyltransferase [bacterium]